MTGVAPLREFTDLLRQEHIRLEFNQSMGIDMKAGRARVLDSMQIWTPKPGDRARWAKASPILLPSVDEGDQRLTLLSDLIRMMTP